MTASSRNATLVNLDDLSAMHVQHPQSDPVRLCQPETYRYARERRIGKEAETNAVQRRRDRLHWNSACSHDGHSSWLASDFNGYWCKDGVSVRVDDMNAR